MKLTKRLLSVLLAFLILTMAFGVIGENKWGFNALALESTGVAVIDNFINDSRFTNGVSWGNVGPQLSPYDCCQCCAYAADFVKYCFGYNSPTDGTYFTGATNIRAGDVLLVGNGSNGYGHWFVCLNRRGNDLYVAEGNWGGRVRIGWNYSITNDSTIAGASYSFTCGWHYLGAEPAAEFNAVASVSGNRVYLCWTDINAKSYYVYTWLKESNVVTFGQDYGRNCYTYLNLSSGSYTAYITATMYDNSQKTISVDFSLPSSNTFTLSTNVVNNHVGIAWQDIGANNYFVSVKKSNQEVWSGSTGSQNYVFLLLANGDYTATVTANMPNGSTRTASTTFTAGTKISLSVDPNGGQIGGNSSVKTTTAFAGDSVTLRIPQRDGYEFEGWSIDGAGTISPKSYCYPYGTPIYPEKKFYESILVYNNNQNGAVAHTVLDAEVNSPSVSGKMIKIVTSGNALPALGGFMQYTDAAVRGVYYHVFKAKIPVGYTLKCASNDIGYQGKLTWLTDQKGTGNWETYVYRVDCGFVGNFQSFGHVYLTSDDGKKTVTWYLCASNIYDATAIINGKNSDPSFTVRQPLLVYNNLENNTVSLARVSKTDSSCPSTYSYYLQIKTSGKASPGLGGVYFPVDSKANGVYYQVMVAKIPIGYELERASNPIGDGYRIEWLTDQKGTGKWETYICRIICGATGTFGTLGHWFLKPLNGQTTVTWYVCYANIFDSTPTFKAGTKDTLLTAQWKKIENALQSIVINTLPSKTTYLIGENFDQSGLSLTATYSDGSTETITNGYVCSGFSSTTEGTKVITVTYENFTTSFNVTVNEHKPTDPTPTDPQPSGGCPWCGGNHDGFFGWLIRIIHNILAAIFGAKY